MWSYSLLVLLLGTCVQVYGQYGYSDPMMMMGGYGSWGSDTYDGNFGTDSLLLNCFARYDDDNGGVASEIAVNIQAAETSLMAPYDMYGYGSGGMGMRSTQKLSARIELINNVVGPGQAFVVFTEKAREDQGCTYENFGDILLRDDGERHGGKHSMGLSMFGLGSGLGTAAAYGLGGYGLGMGGYGYGGMIGGYGGYGSGGGYGAGYGMGDGGGHMYSDDGPEDGVVTVLNFSPGALTTAVVDDVGFNALSDLAGRGVLICSDITYDWNWNPRCTEPFFSCCALKYDDRTLSLVG